MEKMDVRKLFDLEDYYKEYKAELDHFKENWFKTNQDQILERIRLVGKKKKLSSNDINVSQK